MERIDWYNQRNNRTNLMEGVALESWKSEIGVIIEDSSNLTNQLMAIITLNVMARWCGNITIQLEEAECLLHNNKGSDFKSVIKSTITAADPYNNLTFKNITGEDLNLVLVIGRPPKDLNFSYYWIDAGGWIGGFGFGRYERKRFNKKNTNSNLLGASFSAVSANALLFEDFLGLRRREVLERWTSLYDLVQEDSPEELKNPDSNFDLDIGKCLQIGAGAVGSSFDYLISLIPVGGDLTIVDYDSIEASNTSSSLVFSYNDALKENKKIKACEKVFVESDHFNLQVHDGDYSSYQSKAEVEDYPDLILCLANERNIWSSIQYNDPPLVLSATTSSNWGVNFGRHIPFKERCIVCTFGNEEYAYTPVCSEGVVLDGTGKEKKLGSLPFLSAMSATMVLAEIFKLNNPSEYPVNANFIQISMRDLNNSGIQQLQIPKGEGCSVCKEQNMESYYPEYFNSKFFKTVHKT